MPLASPTDRQPPALILASGSAARVAMLAAARVPFEAMPAPVDEAAVKAGMLGEGASPRDIADALAELKARRVAARVPGLVVGADQVLSCDGRLFDKPRDLAEAREQLLALRGRTHELHAAAVAYEEASPVWRHVGRARLTMRAFGEAFLDSYLASEGEAVCDSVGGYRIEAGGAQLFARVEGDLFTIMGLPLLELLDFLRSRRVVPE
jgi:septum formation protein